MPLFRIWRRQASGGGTNEFLSLIADPFQSQVGSSIVDPYTFSLMLYLGTSKLHIRCYNILVHTVWRPLPPVLLDSTLQ
jgi:hypothetical protein